MEVGRGAANKKNKINMLVTASHIIVTLAYTISQFSMLFYKNSTQSLRMESAFVFFGGLADLFLSLMLWFIFDTEKVVAFVVDGDKVYAVQEVIKPHQTNINDEDCVEEVDQDDQGE